MRKSVCKALPVIGYCILGLLGYTFRVYQAIYSRH